MLYVRRVGRSRVYFPLRERWEARAPDWAKGQWERVKTDLEEWCAEAHIPLVIDDESWACFED
jgi:hypothetical protein